MLTQIRQTRTVKLMDRLLQRLAPTPMVPCDYDCQRQPVGWVYTPGQWRKTACGRHMRRARRAGQTVEYWVD